MKNTKIKNTLILKRKVKNIILVAALIIVLNTIFSIRNSYSKVEVKYKSEYASQGDTLWSIAERESKNNKYYQDKDIREIIYDLKKVNNITNSSLKEGQEIKIPKI